MSVTSMCLPKLAVRHAWRNTGDKVHTITLSNIDQGLTRTYVRMGLCYPLPAETLPSTVLARLEEFVAKTVRCLPHLSGKVVVVKDAAQQDTVAVQFSRNDVLQYRPVARHLTKTEYPFSFEKLSQDGMPADALISEKLNRMPDKPDENDGPAPVLVIQANFIEGGLIVTLYLHHSVGDGLTLAHIIRGVFRNGFRETIDIDDDQAIRLYLDEDASRRRQMSGDNHGRPDGSRLPLYHSIDKSSPARRQLERPETMMSKAGVKVLSFSISRLKALKAAINDSLLNGNPHISINASPRPTYVSTFNVLASLLWRSIVRARSARLDVSGVKDWALIVPVNIRGRITCPLTDAYLGNGVASSMTRLSTVDLLSRVSSAEDINGATSAHRNNEHTSNNGMTSWDLPSSNASHIIKPDFTESHLVNEIAPIAVALRSEISKIDASYTENLIAAQNALPDASLVSRMNVNFDTDLFITTWVDMPVYSASDLGLDLGNARWARKTSAKKEAYGALILEPTTAAGKDGSVCKVLEVMMQLREDDIEHVLQDEEVMQFVERVA
ncbi:MAG: hypothetical protein Q9160_006875 [Pyrenula sp. 1 TL-2023]